MQSDLLLNPFIGSHLHSLMIQIKELALSQYVVPFVSVRLQVIAFAYRCFVLFPSFISKPVPHFTMQALATAFNMSIHDVEATLCSLIERRQVKIAMLFYSSLPLHGCGLERSS